MRVLGIETSCDETAVAIVEGDGERFAVVEDVVASQVEQHRAFGGVVPEVAARMHVPVLPKLIEAVTQWESDGIDGIAATCGPGLATALRVGIETAKALAAEWKLPLIPVDHIEGHVYASFLGENWRMGALKNIRFPILCLIVSGGHTELVLMKNHGAYTFLGQTRDDAVGEAFDKTAAQLGLPYPGGPSISKAAVNGDAHAADLPRPMMESGDLDFSFSGLKTAVRVAIGRVPTPGRDEHFVANVAASFQQAVIDVLVHKTVHATKRFAPAAVMICGGVSANRELRRQMEEALRSMDVPLMLPEMAYTGDNAAMIGAAGLRGLVDGREAEDLFVVDADPGKTLGRSWKWQAGPSPLPRGSWRGLAREL